MKEPTPAQAAEHERLVEQLVEEGYGLDHARLKASIRLGLPVGDRLIPPEHLDDPET